MSETALPYEQWIEDALRGVVRRALDHTVRHGLIGDHHFFITFTTTAPGVVLNKELLARYPQEMTIVLQHQFDDLVVDETGFGVTLRFGGRPTRLSIPYAAITAFGDPSVNFGLQLQGLTAEASVGSDGIEATVSREQSDEPPTPAPGPGQVIALDTFRKK